MLKKFIILVIASLFSTLVLAKFEIQTSYPLGVLTAAYTWSDVGMNSQKLKEILDQKISGQEELREKIKISLDKLPRFCSGKDERNDCHNSRELIVQMALESKDLDELSKKMVAVWSLSQVTDLMNAIAIFAPQYEKEIWKKNEKEFRHLIEVMNKLSEKMKADEFLNKVKAFYGSNWPQWLPNIIAVYPVPAQRGHTSGSSYGHFAEQAILLNEKEAASVLAISFHEMAHGYYRFQDKPTKDQWSQIMNKLPLKERYIFDALLNEGLATILGNGIAYELMTGSMDTTEWYNDAYIENFSRSNFELIQKRFIDKAPMTADDFKTMAANFKKTSTDWETNPRFYAKTFSAYFSPQHKPREAVSYLRPKHMAHSVHIFQKYEPELKQRFEELATFYVFLKTGEKLPAPVEKLIGVKVKPSQKPAIQRIDNKERWINVVWYNDMKDLKQLFP
jgi:hypothetical protein